MLKQSNSILRLCIVVVVVMLVQILPVLSQDVKIGTQTWTSKNLDVSTFRNGEPIPEAKNAKEWSKASDNRQPAWCYYDYDERNGKKYGKLYNWFAVSDSRGLAPNGYHIPTDEEWTILTNMLGEKAIPGDTTKRDIIEMRENIAGKMMKCTSGWADGGNGENSSGFNGLPGGYCDIHGIFRYITRIGFFWSSSNAGSDDNYAWLRMMFYDGTRLGRQNYIMHDGYSVRCIRD